MQTIGITITAYNEENNIEACMKSITWADEIVLINCMSEDNTGKIASKYTDKIYDFENDPNININKNRGIDKISSDWVLILDADERVPEELKEEIKTVLKEESRNTGFFIPRKNFYFGKWLRYGGNYPDFQLRLFKKGLGSFPAEHVHERIKLAGNAGYLKNSIEHYPYNSVSEYFNKFNFYTDFEARYMKERGVKVTFRNSLNYFFITPFLRFVRRYFLKGGFKNGIPGISAVIFDCLSYTVRYIKLWELHKNK